MSYTTEEIQEAVEKLVRTSIRRTQGALGNREVGVTFNDYQDAAAGVFLLFANAPFYLVYLGCRNLQEVLQTERDAVGELIDLVDATGRSVTPIKDLGPLANARVALDGMLLASGSRTKTFQSVEDVPAYKRFDRNTQRFLDESSKNVKEDGELVRTPAEARGLLAGQYNVVKDAHEDVLRRVGLLSEAITDYDALELPARMVEAILENARDSLQGWYNQLSEMKEQDRLKLIRSVTLDILAARSTVKGFGSLTGSTIFVPLEGMGGVFADANHPATPAQLSSELYGPYAILDDAPILHVTVEGDSTAIELQGSFVAAIDGTVYAPYLIGHPNNLGASGLNNNQLTIQMLNRVSWGGVETFYVEWPENATSYEAWEAAAYINYNIGSLPLICEPYPNPLKFGGLCDVTWDGGNGWFEFESTTTDFSSLNIIEGAYILIPPQNGGLNAYLRNSIFQVRSGGVGTTTLLADLVFNPDGFTGSAAFDDTDVEVRITDDELPIRMRITGLNDYAVTWDGATTWGQTAKTDYRETALNNRWGFGFPAAGPPTGARVVGDVDLTGLTLPGDVVGDTLTVYWDGVGSDTADLTGFAGTTPSALAAELNSQLANVNVTVQSGTNFLRIASQTPGGDSSIRLTAGSLLDDVFTGGVAGAPYEGVGSDGDEIQLYSATALGFYPGMEVLCLRTPASVVATNITDSPAAAINKQARVEAEEFFSPVYYDGRGRTDPFDFLKIIATIFEEDSVVATAGAPGVYSFAATGAATAGVTTAHKLVVRASSDPDDIGHVGDILSVSDTAVEADFAYTLQGSLSDMDIEVGPDLTYPNVIGHEATASVSGGPQNDGEYGILDVGAIPFELELDRPLDYPADNANLPRYFNLEVGRYGVVFKSTDETLATQLAIHDNGGDTTAAYDRFFGPQGVVNFIEAAGSTAYYLLPEWNKQLNEGDLFELYYYPNQVAHSEELDSLYWSSTGVTITPDAADGPFTGTLADELVETTDNSRHEVVRTTIPLGGYYVQHSCYVKATGRSILSIRGNNPWGGAWFDLVAKTVTLSTNWNAPTTSSILKELGDGWFYCAILRKVSAPTVTVATFGAAASTSTTTYVGSGASALLLYGLQVCSTDHFVSYTPTQVTELPRSGDATSAPGLSTPIVSLEKDNLLIKLTDEQPTDLFPASFDTDAARPFARIRNARMNNYSTLQESLGGWLELSQNQGGFFTNLRRLLNPLAVNTNPTAVQLNDAKSQLELLEEALDDLGTYLGEYAADVVPQIDVLLSTLQEKGADRARDILLEARFSDFFGLGMDETSYAGTVQSTLKEINREDLPVRKDNRTGRMTKDEQLIAAYDEKDYEFDTSDLDEAEELDIPVGTAY